MAKLVQIGPKTTDISGRRMHRFQFGNKISKKKYVFTGCLKKELAIAKLYFEGPIYRYFQPYHDTWYTKIGHQGK